MGILDVTREQLRQLDGDSLRELVALLCEAEIQQAGMPISAVKWGGAHTAADGGLDVEVDLENQEFRGDFVPRKLTGFQVKKPSMPPSRIPAEMSPNGQLRTIFHDLAKRNGCYVIVSAADDPSESRLTERLDAMREQVSPVRKRRQSASRLLRPRKALSVAPPAPGRPALAPGPAWISAAWVEVVW